MKSRLLYLIILVVALAPAANASEKQVRIEDTVLKTITQQNGSAVFTLKSNWLTYRANQKPELVKAGEAITLMADSEITIVEKHSTIRITYKPGIGIVLETTHDARSVGGSIQTSIEVLEIK
jgi:hypothetical protein